MELVTLIANCVAAIANTCIALSLLTFRRGHRRYRRFVSLCAWLLFNLSLSNAYWLLVVGLPSAACSVTAACLYVFLAYRFLHSRGNVVDSLHLSGQKDELRNSK